MNLVIITQNDSFYLPQNLEYLIKNLPKHSHISAAVVLSPSPFGKKESFIRKCYRTISIFGLSFFLHYGVRFIIKKLQRRDVIRVFYKYNIPVIKLEKSINHPSSLDKIANYSPDLIISIAGNEIFKKRLIELAPKGLLNLHSALLPKNRGLFPTFWTLKNRDEYAGVSVFFVDEGIDSGPILVQKRIPVGNMTLEELIVATKKLGIDAVIEAINLIEQGNYKLIENDHNKMTYFSFPTKKDVKEFRRIGKRFY